MTAPSDPAFPTAASGQRWDCVALGEVMLRFDPGEDRIRTARTFRVFEGGGEYNVARGLRKTFGHSATVLTALPRNELGRLAADLIMQGGVDTSHVVWRAHDGVGRTTRMGLNFTERGFGVRGALGLSDRANSAASQLRADEFDWQHIFVHEGARWLHTGGIFAALSESTAQTAIAAVCAARQAGVVVSFDLNYRASLWHAHPDANAARRVCHTIAAECDLLVADDFALATCLGIGAEAAVPRTGPMDPAPATVAAQLALRTFPQLKAVAFTLRDAYSASRNAWAGFLLTRAGLHASRERGDLDVLDRVGCGDAFLAGLIHGFLAGADVQHALDLGAAHGAWAMTTPGDNASASAEEIDALAHGAAATVRR